MTDKKRSDKKRETKLREAIDACHIIADAIEWLEENVRHDIPDSYRYSVAVPATSDMRARGQEILNSLERQLGRELHKPEPSLFDRLLKTKCERQK